MPRLRLRPARLARQRRVPRVRRRLRAGDVHVDGGEAPDVGPGDADRVDPRRHGDARGRGIAHGRDCQAIVVEQRHHPRCDLRRRHGLCLARRAPRRKILRRAVARVRRHRTFGRAFSLATRRGLHATARKVPAVGQDREDHARAVRPRVSPRTHAGRARPADEPPTLAADHLDHILHVPRRSRCLRGVGAATQARLCCVDVIAGQFFGTTQE